jgi:outer membrane protein TolC
VEDNLRAELAAAHSEYLSAQGRVAVSRNQIVPDAEKALAQTQEEYHEGKRNLLDLLDARLALINARLSYLAQLRDCNLAHARIVSLTRKTAGL